MNPLRQTGFFPRSLVLAGLCLGIFGTAAPARAVEPSDLGTTFKVNDDDPLSNIPTDEERMAHPVEFGYYMQDLVARAEGGFKAKDYARAVKYFEVIARIVPEHALTFSRLCTSYAELGRPDVASANCARAIRLPGATIADHLHFIRYTLDKPKFTATDAADIDASLAHLREKKADLWTPPVNSAAAAPSNSAAPSTPDQKGTDAAKSALTHLSEADAKTAAPPPNLRLQIETLACRLAVRLEDAKRLNACVDALKSSGADPRLVLSFDWSRALVTGDRKSADALLDQARTLKMPDSALAAMEAEQDRYMKPTGLGILTHGKSGRITALVVTLALIGGALLWMFAGNRRRKLPAEDRA